MFWVQHVRTCFVSVHFALSGVRPAWTAWRYEHHFEIDKDLSLYVQPDPNGGLVTTGKQL